MGKLALILIAYIAATFTLAPAANKTVGICHKVSHVNLTTNATARGLFTDLIHKFFPQWNGQKTTDAGQQPVQGSNVTRSILPAKKCGQSTTMAPVTTRIVGGVELNPNSMPWLVSIQASWIGHFCGGSLINVGSDTETDIVLTAGHCIVPLGGGLSGITVSAGAHDLQKVTDGQQTVNVADAVYHQDYKEFDPNVDGKQGTINDVGILKLETPVKFTKTASPICLPTKKGDTPADGAFGIVAGWGALFESTNPTASHIPNQVAVPVINKDTCIQEYKAYKVDVHPEYTLCAGYKDGRNDSCQGDSGGPLIFAQDGAFTQEGIVSFGIGCARAGVPGMYTHLSNYMDWVNEAIKQYSAVAKNAKH